MTQRSPRIRFWPGPMRSDRIVMLVMFAVLVFLIAATLIKP
jgi:hypothetical protein